MKLIFGECEDAVEIIALMGKKCTPEVRAAVENWNQDGRVEFHGHSYILEAVPLQIETADWAGPDNLIASYSDSVVDFVIRIH